ncbi:hypothetical protein NC652_014753 [Populus alba x Populus x berolinensis]|uniref:Uncharacterized protein n=1 Tax=Populus alba x Populus x berolinensis TaxID=444605 RepID=A0AAD6QWW1_9ROSI|nr:hypothetical protein NC652_014753 [Populus alba x Populus x berolinensis]KAJ6998151.1 hypothetical protein NC653_014367 [Populus alba x Populus x berolinensis]
MDSVAESSKNRKRLRQEEEQQQKEEIEDEETSSTDQTLSLVDSLTFSDTMVALRIMRAQFPHIDKVSIQPFILHSQLYSSVKDRTQVDRELESMRREKVLRVFKLNTGQDDHAIMFLDDYLTQVDRVVKRMEEKKQRNLEVFEWFKAHVIDNKQDPSIDDQELVSSMDIYLCCLFTVMPAYEETKKLPSLPLSSQQSNIMFKKT